MINSTDDAVESYVTSLTFITRHLMSLIIQ